ncbi:MAG: serine/threonine protein kinase [Chloroflexi bacterium]|nr:serine/threonine protein kinase [Chloroflexota bacterium]
MGRKVLFTDIKTDKSVNGIRMAAKTAFRSVGGNHIDTADGFIIVSGIQGVNFGSTANIRATISIKALKAGHYRIECIIDWSPSAVVWICLIVGIFVFGILWLVALLYLFVNPDASYKLALDRIQGEVGMMSSVPQPALSSTSAATSIAQAGSGVQRVVMEYSPSGTLASELETLRKKNEALPIQKAVEIAKQIAQALEYVHQKGVVHCDIKPSNILIADDGRYVLSDFGIVTDSTDTKITRTLQTLGTPEYMSPEQANGLSVDRRSDVYSLGVVLYEMLTGAPPFSDSNALSLLNKHLTAPPPSLSKIRVGIPSWLQSIVQKTLEKQPERRFQTAAELVVALQQQSTDRISTITGRRIPLMPLGIGLGVVGMLAGVGLLLSAVLNRGGDAEVGILSNGGSATTVVTSLQNVRVTSALLNGITPTTATGRSPTVATGTRATPTLISTLNSPTLVTVTPVLPAIASDGGVTPSPLPPTFTPTFTPRPPTMTPTFTPISTLNSPILVAVTPVPPTIASGGGVTPPPLLPTFTPKLLPVTPTFTPKPPPVTPTFTPALTRTPTKMPSGPTSTPCVPISKCILLRTPLP